MVFLTKALMLALALAAEVLASPLAKRGMTCTELLIPVTINSTNIAINSTGAVTPVPVQGTYNIGARYCEPLLQVRPATLQVLVHGITYTRNYWSGAGPPGQGYKGDTYSWIAFASTQAYPTLSIDRLGNGLSSHPDPTTVVQVNSEVDVIHQLILKARNGQLPGPAAGRMFTKIIYVGHSFGSLLGNKLTALYPADVNAAILTGWTPTVTQSLKDQLAAPGSLAPAAYVDPIRFVSLNPNYFMINNISVAQNLFYYKSNYDLALFNLDYKTRGTVSSGEYLSGGLEPFAPAPGFTGPVLLLAGQRDNCFCPSATGGPNCGSGGWSPSLAATTSNLYPAASCFDAYSLPDVGHCWQFHYRAQLGFAVAHTWLAVHGF